MRSSQGTIVNPSQRWKSVREMKKDTVIIVKSSVKRAARDAIIKQLRPREVHFKMLILFVLPLIFMLSICGMKKNAVRSICNKPTKKIDPVALMTKTDIIEASANEIALE